MMAMILMASEGRKRVKTLSKFNKIHVAFRLQNNRNGNTPCRNGKNEYKLRFVVHDLYFGWHLLYKNKY